MTRRHTWNDRDKKGTDATERKLTKLSWLGTYKQTKKKYIFTNQIRTVGSKGAELYTVG